MSDLQKYNDSKRGLLAHDERSPNEPVKYRKNYSIDETRTYMNYDLVSGATSETARRGDLEKRLEARLAQLTIRKRRENTVTFGSWVVTLPRELKDAPPEKQREFFQHTTKFVQNRYGVENVIGAWVHNDETTPHIHIKFVPEERKKTFDAEGKDITDYNRHEGTGVLLGKDIFKRGEYQTFHRDLQRYLEQEMGMQLSILNGATKVRGKNATTDELKSETARLQQKAQEAAQARLAGEVRGMVNGIYNAMPTTAAAVEVFQAAADFFKVYAEHEEGLVSENEVDERQAEPRERLQAALEGRGMGFDSPGLE